MVVPGTFERLLLKEVKTRGLSAYSLANLSGVGRRTVERWLGNESGINLATADRLAGALGITATNARAKTRPVEPEGEAGPDEPGPAAE
jgi:transcriptional regulator with XRE-family HTH domain